MKRIRIGVMGCANIAKRSFIPAIIDLPDQFQLVAVASRSLGKSKVFAEQFNCVAIEGYQKLLDMEIDAVYIPLPTGLNHIWVIKALEAGKHVIAEKSLALDFRSCDLMVNLARKQGLLLMEDFMFRYHSQHDFVFSQISDNAIGELRLLRSDFGFPPLPVDNFRYDMNLGGGALFDAGAYTLKASSWFLGESARVVSARLNKNEKGTDIYGSACLTNDSGLVAQVGFGFDNHYQCKYEIWGSKGKITAGRAFTPGPDFKPPVIIEKGSEIQTYELGADNHFVGILKEFHRAISKKDFERHYKETLLQATLVSQCVEMAGKG